ncbi:hypothetical protein BRYFOR_08852 [Marvinbryantia formatexigens DSM 14469]|uniref:Uncharacterized protein n=1 Tax=Marvinbryantia formatexigens DSM 14469 TaxID=478749 RepID=C6LJL5_9FIRM|nr:hypothetical protein BRYFOR_08852 [Marvinbryantia formatexigens DSM 14469]
MNGNMAACASPASIFLFILLCPLRVFYHIRCHSEKHLSFFLKIIYTLY